MLVKNNYDIMNTSEVIDKPVTEASDVSMRINVEFLRDCAFHCSGCYVQRKNHYTENDLTVLSDLVQMFKQGGFNFDEIILGPTDFFAAYNTEQLLAEPKFNQIFKDGDVVLTILSTLQSEDEVILNRINELNKHLGWDGMEIEVLVIFDLEKVLASDMEYVKRLKHKISLLDQLKATVDYALQMNIQNLGVQELPLAAINAFIKEHFDSIVEFNPSFMRTGNMRIMEPVIKNWNKMLERNITSENKNDITVTMANQYHSGFNEITYNFKDGQLYMCPFIYENVFDKSDVFKVNKEGSSYTIDDIMAHDLQAKQSQFNYVSKTTECETCPNMLSCISKHVIFYMEAHEITDCIVSKKVMDLYSQ